MNQKQNKELDEKSVITMIALVVFYPLGIFLMWKWTSWNKWIKVLLMLPLMLIILAISSIMVVFIIAAKDKASLGHFEIRGIAMAPNFKDGQVYKADNNIYKTQFPQRGDVIIFKSPRDPNIILDKRIIGLPGETVEIRGGRVYLNGIEFEEPYLQKDIYTHQETFLTEYKKITIPENSYCVMGDNRPHSSDSREWGFVSKGNIIAKLLECTANCTGER